MRSPSWLVLIVTFVFEIIAFGLALGAMSRRSKASLEVDYLTDDTYCEYSSEVATGLAAGAIVMLLFGQAVIMGVTGCFCCGSGSYTGKARACAILAFILTWFFFIIAEICLIVGASLNKVHTTVHYNGSLIGCKEVRKGVFGAAAAFTFLTLLFSELYYVTVVRASDGAWQQSYKNGAPTISMTAYP